MRVTWLSHRDPFGKVAGGAERTIREVCPRLVARGHEVSVYAVDPMLRQAELSFDGVHVYYSKSWIGAHARLHRSRLELSHTRVEIHDLAHLIPWDFNLLRKKQRTRVIPFFHHLHARTLRGQVGLIAAGPLGFAERLYPRIYHGRSFVTESRSSRADLEQLGVPSESIVVIPPGVAVDQFVPLPLSDIPQLIYFGGLRPYKRPECAIHLVRSLLDRGVRARMIFVGEGPQLPRLVRLARALELQRSVEFVGRIPDHALSEYVGRSWLNVHCAVSEGWGFSVMEASSAGVPTVAFDARGLSDSVQDGTNGLLVTSGDESALADAACKILERPDEWRRPSRRWAEGFSWETTTDLWSKLITTLTSHSEPN